MTIANFVADLRAPTPSAEAELVSRNQLELLRQLQSQRQRLKMAMDYSLAQRQQHYGRLQHRLHPQHPQLRLARQQTALMALRRHKHLRQRLHQQAPTARINSAQQQLQTLRYQLNQSISRRVSRQNNAFVALCSPLEGVSSLKTLARWFSVTTDSHGAVVKQTRQLSASDCLTTRLSDGWVESQVTQITRQPAKRQRRSKD